MKQIFMLLFAMSTFISSAQNNPIFGGGNGDGWERSAYIQTANNIFTGGNGGGWNKGSFSQAGTNIFTGGNSDGWTSVSFLQSSSNIFNGGDADGWSSVNFIQSGNNIFNGGIADGWSSVNFLQTGNNIFNGGNADGWDRSDFLQSGNNIFNGGEGDGWSSTYRPTGPLPVNLLSFEARKQDVKKSYLTWQTSSETNSAWFIVERSTDAIHFIPIGRVAATGNSLFISNYSFTDHQPVKGFNYYRLKMVDADNRFRFTPSRVLQFDEIITDFINCYPNPTNGLVNIVVSEQWRNAYTVINVSTEIGAVVLQLKLAPGFNSPVQLNLNGMSKGIYFIHLRSGMLNKIARIVVY